MAESDVFVKTDFIRCRLENVTCDTTNVGRALIPLCYPVVTLWLSFVCNCQINLFLAKYAFFGYIVFYQNSGIKTAITKRRSNAWSCTNPHLLYIKQSLSRALAVFDITALECATLRQQLRGERERPQVASILVAATWRCPNVVTASKQRDGSRLANWEHSIYQTLDNLQIWELGESQILMLTWMGWVVWEQAGWLFTSYVYAREWVCVCWLNTEGHGWRFIYFFVWSWINCFTTEK